MFDDAPCSQTGKRRYATPGEAKQIMLRFKEWFSNWMSRKRNKRRGRKPKQKRIYFCSYCKGYHLTSHDYRTHKVSAEWELYKKQQLEQVFKLIR